MENTIIDEDKNQPGLTMFYMLLRIPTFIQQVIIETMCLSLLCKCWLHQEIQDLCYYEVYGDDCVDSKAGVMFFFSKISNLKYLSSNTHLEVADINICANSSEKSTYH